VVVPDEPFDGETVGKVVGGVQARGLGGGEGEVGCEVCVWRWAGGVSG
jgi:outer membrane lipoprotein SlyB